MTDTRAISLNVGDGIDLALMDGDFFQDSCHRVAFKSSRTCYWIIHGCLIVFGFLFHPNAICMMSNMQSMEKILK